MADSTYTKTVLADSPVGYWKLDDAVNGREANRGSTDGYTAVYENTESAFSFVDPSGESQYFNGSNSYVQLGTYDPPIPNTNIIYDTDRISIEFWVSVSGKRYNNLKNKVIFAFAHYNDTLNDFAYNYMAYIDKYNNLSFKVFDGIDDHLLLTSNEPLLENKSYHVVILSNQNEHKLYINGYLNVQNLEPVDPPLISDDMQDHPFHLGDIKSTTGSGGTGTLYSAFNSEEWSNFNGTIDEVALYDYLLSDFRILAHYQYGFGGNFSERIGERANYEIQYRVKRYDIDRSYAESIYDYCGNFEKSPLYTEGGEEKNYLDYVRQELKPDFWYSMDAPIAAETNRAPGSFGTPALTYFEDSITDIVEGATDDVPPNLARKFNANRGYGTIATDLGATASEDDNPFTIAFWYKHDNSQAGIAPILGFQKDAADDHYGFHLFIGSNNKILIHKYSNVEDFYTLKDSHEREDDDTEDWNHYVITISDNGKMVMYRNGSAVSEAASDGKGLIKPPSDAVFSISKSTHHNDKTNMYIDELMMFNRQLDSYEVSLLYRSARDGTVQVAVTAGEDIEFNSSKQQRAKFDTLVNEVDITHNVVAYTIERDLDQQASVAVIQMTEEFLNTEVKNLLKANTYITIEERLVDSDGEYDSGWMNAGHFLVDGPVGTDIEADQGAKVMNIKASSPSKIFGFDLVTYDLDPDVIEVGKRIAELKSESINSYRFGMRRPGTEDTDLEAVKWYRNWADYPAVRMWVSEFTAFTDDAERKLLDAREGEELRIKGSGGSIQVLFGEGVVVIDRDFFEDPVAENGLGNPSYQDGGVRLAFRRFATNEDLVNAQIAAIYEQGGRTYVTFNQDIYDGNAKTVIMKSGESKGRFFKIYEVPDA